MVDPFSRPQGGSDDPPLDKRRCGQSETRVNPRVFMGPITPTTITFQPHSNHPPRAKLPPCLPSLLGRFF